MVALPAIPSKTLELLSYNKALYVLTSSAPFFRPIFYLREDMTLILAKMISTGSKTRLGIHGTGQELA